MFYASFAAGLSRRGRKTRPQEQKTPNQSLQRIGGALAFSEFKVARRPGPLSFVVIQVVGRVGLRRIARGSAGSDGPAERWDPDLAGEPCGTHAAWAGMPTLPLSRVPRGVSYLAAGRRPAVFLLCGAGTDKHTAGQDRPCHAVAER